MHFVRVETSMTMGMGIVNGTLGEDGQTYYGRLCHCITLYQITLPYITLNHITLHNNMELYFIALHTIDVDEDGH